MAFIHKMKQNVSSIYEMSIIHYTSDEYSESKSEKTLSLDGLCLLRPEIGTSES